ncbi:hypothetical protein M9H77_14084 [Catharanthus roseus]|uniref:Uncharacterized protein n=1 Tax=Catharanthus roseus TaxID=4058 RepID=A0ACC0BM30_CATRO|nr:hypothetical protein M9H77_14084 [Catharanthus roseus]
MEEVPAHVHPDLTVLDILTRQHEHRSGLIWSGDHETCISDLQCRRFGRNLFQAYSTAPHSFGGCTTDRGSLSSTSDLGLVAYSCIATSATPACSARPSCSTWCDVLHILIPSTFNTWFDLHRIQLRGNDHTYWGTQHAIHVEVWHQWQQHIRDGPVLPVEDLSSPRDDYIRWYRDIKRVYIGNQQIVILVRLDTSLLGSTNG